MSWTCHGVYNFSPIFPNSSSLPPQNPGQALMHMTPTWHPCAHSRATPPGAAIITRLMRYHSHHALDSCTCLHSRPAPDSGPQARILFSDIVPLL